MTKPLILITNDDSHNARGIQFVADVLSEIAEVWVCAPTHEMSGQSHSITINTPLRYYKIDNGQKYNLVVIEGTPADCVKLALDQIVPRKPDLIVSGINHGSNASVNVIYSGTMAAVIEGCMSSIPSVGFSILDHSPNPDFEPFKDYILKLCSNILEKGMKEGTCLNVNFPNPKTTEIKGFKVCRQAMGYWKEGFDKRTDPHGREYFWLKGVYVSSNDSVDTDITALDQGYVSVVPIQYDLTNHSYLDVLKKEYV